MTRAVPITLLLVVSALTFADDPHMSKLVEDAKSKYICSKLPNAKISKVAYDSRPEGNAAFFWCSPDHKINKLIVVATKKHPWTNCGETIKTKGSMPGLPLGTIQDTTKYKPIWQSLDETTFALEKPTKKSMKLARLINRASNIRRL